MSGVQKMSPNSHCTVGSHKVCMAVIEKRMPSVNVFKKSDLTIKPCRILTFRVRS